MRGTRSGPEKQPLESSCEGLSGMFAKKKEKNSFSEKIGYESLLTLYLRESDSVIAAATKRCHSSFL